MRQTLHILRKDVRRHWIEILLVLALLAAYAWRAPTDWVTPAEYDFFVGARFSLGLGFAPGLIGFFVYVSWCLLVVRVIQAEALAGDRQFWVTRPYEWPSLLLAKAVFFAIFISAPYFVMELIVLHEAGFQSSRYITGVLKASAFLWFTCVLPVSALSVVTETVVQVLLCLLAALLYAIGLGLLSSIVPNSAAPNTTGVPGTPGVVLFFLACFSAVAMQYVRRRTNVSRWLLIAGAVAALVLLAATPYRALLNHSYPAANTNGGNPLNFSIQKRDMPYPGREADVPGSKTVLLGFPISNSLIAPAEFAVIDAMQTTVTAPDGSSWASDWESAGTELWPGNARPASTSTNISSEFFDRVRNRPVNVHLSLAVTRYRETPVESVTAGSGEYRVPEIGICKTEPSTSGFLASWITCRYPLSTPPFVAHLNLSSTSCTSPIGDRSGGPERTVSDASLKGESSSFSPVGTLEIVLGDTSAERPQGAGPVVCPGTVFEIETPHIVGASRVDTEIDGIMLANYRAKFPY